MVRLLVEPIQIVTPVSTLHHSPIGFGATVATGETIATGETGATGEMKIILN